MSLLIATDANFQSEVIQSSMPVLIDFWAVWCGPCKAIAPIVEEIVQEFDGRAKIAKLNVDENPNVAMNYGIRSIPTLLIFKEGQVVDSIVGLVKKDVLVDKLEKHL